MRQTDLLRASAEGKFSYKKQKAKSCTKGKNKNVRYTIL